MANLQDMDARPDWVKSILALRPHLIGFPHSDGRWEFEPSRPVNSPGWPLGEVTFFYVKPSGRMRPSIWNGTRWLDLRDNDGRELHRSMHERSWSVG